MSPAPDHPVNGQGVPESEASGEGAYELFKRGTRLLECRDSAQATVPLEKAKRLQPDKPSIREALGRAYFYSGQYAKAADEFEMMVKRSPVNDYAHFCLGRSLQKLGNMADARRHFTMASRLRPDRADYRRYRLMLEGV